MAFLFRGWEDVEGESLGRDSASSSAVYTELRLRALIRTEEEKERLLELCSGTADVRSASSWTDVVMHTAAAQTGCMDMRKRADTPHELTLRWYSAPPAVKDACTVFHVDRGVLVGGLHAKRTAEAVRVCAVETSQSIRGLLGMLGFRTLPTSSLCGKEARVVGSSSCLHVAAVKQPLQRQKQPWLPLQIHSNLDPKDYAEAEARAMRAAAL
ncbi:hypothetical protein cyc_00080 [Cyclospora cayetanensis]|uniref:Uncharacterized protein n=1 Tax=Cyclospora cayetanensis TaxID=88456 RepID=A0A1D3D1G3_9EIME|nr:hypothetical protein cyc_00080 [Cyclospora cayetanensis]